MATVKLPKITEKEWLQKREIGPYTKEQYMPQAYEPLRQTIKRKIVIKTLSDTRTYEARLDAGMSNEEWEKRYLMVGFREPETGVTIQPNEILSIIVGRDDESVLGTSDAMGWLREQVDEICALAKL